MIHIADFPKEGESIAFEGGNLIMKDAVEEGSEELIAEMFPMTLTPVK